MFSLYEEWGSLLFRKRRNTLGFALVNSQRSSPFVLWGRLCIWPPGVGYCVEGTNFLKITSIFWNPQGSSAAWGTEGFTPICVVGLASPDKGVTKTYHLPQWGPWICFRASQCRPFVQEMATRLCRGCENLRLCTIWKKFQVFQLL